MDEIRLIKRKRKAQNEGNQKLLLSICTDLSELYIKSGQFQQAINEYKFLGDIYKSQKNQIEYARINRAIGEAYLGLNDYKKALEHQKLYLEITINERNDIEIQRAYATIGHIYLTTYLETQTNQQENLNLAYKYFMKSMKLCENLNSISKLEKADMQARLLSNLGLVKESLGDYNKAVELLTTSINICKSNDIYEQLYRGYMSIASLYDKKGDSSKTMHHFNLAIETAKKLKDSVDLMCAALLAKAEALIKLCDFHTAKKSLYKAYKLNTPNKQEKNIIEKYLKTVIKMCRTEDTLVIKSNDDLELKKLYEIMGDCACILKNYTKAIEYYKLMLIHAEKSGVNGRELAACYYSLAETYKDNKMYKEAIDYYEKEYLLCIELKDNLNTLSNIADTKEIAGDSVHEIKEIYNRAITNCKQTENPKELKRMLMRCIDYLSRNNHVEYIDLYRKELNQLQDVVIQDSSSSESETSDTPSEIIDVTTDTESEDDENLLIGKRKPKVFIVKKNAKGESQLHVACINGKIPVVKHLLEQGHPVNVRDNTGWLPIHEACNHGFYDIVQLLLDKGAAVNDRGGTKCEGITPLYDAANNGHIKIVELLLNRGASATIKADNGDTPLNVLKCWHQKYPFVGEEYEIYCKCVEKMSEALLKVGETVKDIEFAHQSDDNEDFEYISDDSQPTIIKEKKSALVREEEETLDDWLEDDIKTTKKRKTNLFESIVTSSTKSTKKNLSSVKRLSDENIRLINENIDETPLTTNKRKYQASLLDSGFDKTITKKKSTPIQKHRSFDTIKQKHITSFTEPDSTVQPQILTQIQDYVTAPQDLMVYVDVKIEGKIFRVPVLLSQIKSNTIGWLADQAAQKYAKKECSKPCLELETISGALLSDEDPLTLLFPLGSTQAESIIGRIVKLYAVPLVERYKEACNHTKETINESIITVLEEVSMKLDVSYRGLQSDTLSPLFKSLNHQNTLLDLDLSGNYIDLTSMVILCASLSTLTNLTRLNLKCTGLTNAHLTELVKVLSSNELKLKHLDLSNNYLLNKSITNISIIVDKLDLESLIISNVNFDSSIFNNNVNIQLNNVSKLNLSNNSLNNDNVNRFINNINVDTLIDLDLSNNLIDSVDLQRFKSIKHLNLSRTNIKDDDLYKILSNNNLIQLNLSYNNNLTGITLRRVLEHNNLVEINLIGCDNIFEYFHRDFVTHLEENNEKIIKITIHNNNLIKESLIERFKNLYSNNSIKKGKELLLMNSN